MVISFPSLSCAYLLLFRIKWYTIHICSNKTSVEEIMFYYTHTVYTLWPPLGFRTLFWFTVCWEWHLPRILQKQANKQLSYHSLWDWFLLHNVHITIIATAVIFNRKTEKQISSFRLSIDVAQPGLVCQWVWSWNCYKCTHANNHLLFSSFSFHTQNRQTHTQRKK